MLVLVLFSAGNPAVLIGDMPELTLVPAALLLMAALVLRDDRHVEARDGVVFMAFLSLTLLHLVSVPGATATASAGFFIRLVIGYCAIRLVHDAPVMLVRVLTIVAALSLAIFLLDQLMLLTGVDLAAGLQPIAVQHGEAGAVHVGVHNFNAPLDRHRNSGLFWEPGAMAGYAMLALILLAFARDRVSSRRYSASIAVLVMAVLSTLSTTGYLLLPAVLLLHVLRATGRRGGGFAALALAVALPALAAIAYAAFELPFMRDKIMEQTYSVQDERADWQMTRIGTLLVDLQDIRERPIAGWGANPRVRPSQRDLSDIAQVAQGNGFTNWWVRFGAAGMIVFLGATGIGLRKYSDASRAEVSAACLMLCVLLQGEMFLNYPLFLGLMFLGAASIGQRVWVMPVPIASQRVGSGRGRP